MAISHLHELGFSISIRDQREFGPEHQPDGHVLANAVGDDDQFLRSAAENILGQIIVRGDRDAASRIAQLCWLFPRANILIVAASRGQARWLRRQLASRVEGGISLSFYRSHEPNARITISTPQMVGRYSPGQIHVLLLADPGDAAGAKFQQAIGYLSDHPMRRYAFIAEQRQLSTGDLLRLEAMAGPVICEPNSPLAETEVLICRAISLPVSANLDPLARKRERIWRNKRRNELIARCARAFDHHDLVSLMNLGLMVVPTDEEWLELAAEIKVVILVESHEHARALARFLPDWPVLSMSTSASSSSAQAPAPRYAIVTLTYAMADGIEADVLIRGDGGTFPMNLPGFPPDAVTARAGRVYLIDFDDAEANDPRGANDFAGRVRDYQGRGWMLQDHAGGTLRRQPGAHRNAPDPTALKLPDTSRYRRYSARPHANAGYEGMPSINSLRRHESVDTVGETQILGYL